MSEPTKKHNALLWARITAELLGWPMLIILFSSGAQKTVFTFTCTTASFRCEHSFMGGGGSGSGEDSDKVSALSQVVNQMAGDMGYLKPAGKQKGG